LVGGEGAVLWKAASHARASKEGRILTAKERERKKREEHIIAFPTKKKNRVFLSLFPPFVDAKRTSDA
jgi:hypothetical protein